MSTSMHLPIHLEGDNLGARHRHYNSLVKSSVDIQLEFKSIVQTLETSPIDKIFKIDLASQYRNVEYILETLQDDDMLYVSRALKCLWLLDQQYDDVINPKYLENILFPQMIQPAVNKMRHWLQLNLKDQDRCQNFYKYYNTEFNIAIKFLYHCSPDFILNESLYIIDKLNPKNFKILCEVCPQIAVVYFEKLPLNRLALANYVKQEQNFFRSLKPILKMDGNLYLDILEKYFNSSKMSKLNSSATKYILKNFKSRFNAKRELYVSMLLHTKSLAASLTAEEAKDLTIELAKAEYLQFWFSYQNVEPLIKRLKITERTQLKKDIFINKCIKACYKEWPYSIPTSFKLEDLDKKKVFVDKEYNPNIFQQEEAILQCIEENMCNIQAKMCFQYKTPLDILFDRYRVSGFESTFLELSKKISTEYTIEGRLNMILVLVSKSGGVLSQVTKLLKWLVESHINEPINLRAGVVRSLVKRGCPWRLPQDVWNLFLDFGRDLGLEGETPKLLCREGLHAVVIRYLLSNSTLEHSLLTKFTKEFSTLDKYNLNGAEKLRIGERLANLMVNKQPSHLLDVIIVYRLEIYKIPGAKDSLVKSARYDTDLLHRLYSAKICRRELISLTFRLYQNSASFLNALRHDISLLEGGKCFSELATKERPRHDRFLQTLSLYFSEPNGLASQHKLMLEKCFSGKLNPWFARPLCFLSNGSQLLNILLHLDNPNNLDENEQIFAAEIRSNVHKAKPSLNVINFDLQWIGAKAVANRVLICKSSDLNANIELLLNWTRTARIGFRLALRTRSSSTKAFLRLSTVRPIVALKVALSTYFKHKSIDIEVWNIIKMIIEKLHTKHDCRFLRILSNMDFVPENIKVDYWITIFHLNLKFGKTKLSPIICRLRNMLSDVDQNTVESLIERFISESFNKNDIVPRTISNDDSFLYIRIIAKYLLLCKSETSQNERLVHICNTFFDKLALLNESADKSSREYTYINVALNESLSRLLYSLKYNKVFFDQSYVSCLPVFERIIMHLKRIFPTETHFHLYIELNLTILYYKSIKQAIEQKSEVFKDLEQNAKEAVKIVGVMFGAFIGHDIKDLVSKSFFSIIELYKEVLGEYLRYYFTDGDETSLLVVYIIKGLLDVGHVEAFLLVEYILTKKNLYFIPEPQKNLILNALKQCQYKEVSVIAHEHIFSNVEVK